MKCKAHYIFLLLKWDLSFMEGVDTTCHFPQSCCNESSDTRLFLDFNAPVFVFVLQHIHAWQAGIKYCMNMKMCSPNYLQWRDDCFVLGLSVLLTESGYVRKGPVLFPLLPEATEVDPGAYFMALRCDFRVLLEDVRLSTGKQNNILESRTRAWVMVKLSPVFS